jgi:hypothetical protein
MAMKITTGSGTYCKLTNASLISVHNAYVLVRHTLGRLDKGTFDAVALMAGPENDSTSKTPIDLYSRRVESLLEPGGYFLITCAS